MMQTLKIIDRVIYPTYHTFQGHTCYKINMIYFFYFQYIVLCSLLAVTSSSVFLQINYMVKLVYMCFAIAGFNAMFYLHPDFQEQR